MPAVAEALAHGELVSLPPLAQDYVVADLLARIKAFRRGDEAGPEGSGADADSPPEGFQFETDASGTVIGMRGVAGSALAGLSIAHAREQGGARMDAVAAGAFRRRSRFESARLEVSGECGAAGLWRLSGAPVFDAATGRFTGFRGTGRRPRADESAAPVNNPYKLSGTTADLSVSFERVIGDLAPLAAMRDVRVLVVAEQGARVTADERGAERLLRRLLSTLIAAGAPGEAVRASLYAKLPHVEIAVARPRVLAGRATEALLALDGEEDGASLLGAGFALRVARNLAAELGGALEFGPEHLVLRLPAASNRAAEHVTNT